MHLYIIEDPLFDACIILIILVMISCYASYIRDKKNIPRRVLDSPLRGAALPLNP